MKMLHTASAILLSIAGLTHAQALIDFETQSGDVPLFPGTIISEQFAGDGVHFIGSAFDEPDNPDDLFADNTDMRLTRAGGDVPAAPTIPAGAGNFLHSFSGFLQENGDANLAITFDTPITFFSVDVYDDTIGLTQIFAIEGDEFLGDDQTMSTTNGAVQTLTLTSTTPFSVVGLILGTANDWVGIDNIRYTAVPEPTLLCVIPAWMIMSRKRVIRSARRLCA